MSLTYNLSYLNYGSYGSFAPAFDSRGASVSKEDSEILFYNRKDPYFEELDKIANSDETSVTEYLARSLLGDEKATESCKTRIYGTRVSGQNSVCL